MSRSNPSQLQYTCEISIVRATQVAVGDINTLSSDPYVLASVEVSPGFGTDHELPVQKLTYRTNTVRRTLDPEWNCKWIVSGIPETGFKLTLNLVDEDPGQFISDDKLGTALLRIPQRGSKLCEGWEAEEREYKIEKRKGDMRNHVATYIAWMVSRGKVGHQTRIRVGVRVLGKARKRSEDQNKIYTVGPHAYVRHSSPMIGHVVKASKTANDPEQPGGNGKKLSTTSFMANRLQLTGPVPPSLIHRYVGYRPFIKSMFKRSGIKGRLLNLALHHQFSEIYKYDKNTIWGVVEEIPDQPGRALAEQFLRMTSHGSRGRMFTYVITLDSEMRFTETGEEFAIEMLSKHSMHSDVAKEISYSGEFFVRQYAEAEDGLDENDPKLYELVIDNDSGTYRPKKELLPTLHKWLSSQDNLAGLGKVTTMDGFDETLVKWKDERKEEKRRARGVSGKGKNKEDNDDVPIRIAPVRKGSSVSSISSGQLGSDASSVSSDQVKAAMQEDEKRAEENEDPDRDR